MFGVKKVACVIPARLASKRFPNKMLASLRAKPLLQWVWEAANRVPYFDSVTFAVDAVEIAQLIETFGGKYEMTSVSCQSGTERLIELRHKIDADIWVNWQGDEPFINQQMIQELLQSCDKETSDVWTLKKRIEDLKEATNPHIAKIVCDVHGFALYFSRSQIPHYRDVWEKHDQVLYKHVGIYAFTKEALEKISSLVPCHIEQAEQLEQLRFLYNGLRVRVHETSREVRGIDLPEHLALAEVYLDQHPLV